MEVTIYLVGYDLDHAKGNFPFDSIESAESYKNDNPGMKIYSVTARLDLTTVTEIP